MKKLISTNDNWYTCSLCGEKIKKGEQYFQIKWQNRVGYTRRYRNDMWHIKHFKFRDYSKNCKQKMECVTGQSVNCLRKLCIYNRS